MSTPNAYCDPLGIEVPRLELVSERKDVSFYALLIVALLERGSTLTLSEAAQRFEEAGIAPAASALASLKRCKPGRPPIYRDGDQYALDPHDHETEMWVFRLGLRPRRPEPVIAASPKPAPPPLPTPDQRLTIAELDEAWGQGITGISSAIRIAICVLDAHRAAMRPAAVLEFVRARSKWSMLSADSAEYWRAGAAILVRADGLWQLDEGHAAVHPARKAIRDRIAVIRRWASLRPDPEVLEAHRARYDQEHAENAERLARMTRVILHMFPADKPEVVVVLDVANRKLTTFASESLARVKDCLAAYDMIAAVQVRESLRTLGFDPGDRRLAELGPPQKTMQINRRGRTLKLTASMLIQGSCGISRPFGDPRVMRGYLERGELTKLKRRLEADAKSLYALHEYGRLHGALRLRWGFLDEMIQAPWVHFDEPKLFALMDQALERDAALDIVVRSAPGWADPWARSFRARVVKETQGYRTWLVDELGFVIDTDDVQLARLVRQPG